MKEWAARIALLAGSLLVASLALELALRVAPELLGRPIANQLFSPYTKKPGGIYFRDRRSDMLFMHPDHATHAYFNGYVWNHQTDARGFRNPADRPVNGTLLVGDSLIYGHGAEEEETVASQLERRGRAVYNLSRQGTSLYEHYVLLRIFLESFAPEQVVVFVFFNDFDDLVRGRGLDRLREMPEIARDDYDALRAELAEREPNPHSWSRRIRHASVTYRLLLALRSRGKRAAWTWQGEAEEGPGRLEAPLLDDETRRVLSGYYERILADLAARCEAVGADLYVVYLDAYPATTPETIEARKEALEIVRSAARNAPARYLETGALLECEACALPRDGHLTAEGHRRLAEFLHLALDVR